jgi:hypothetical protein
MRQIIAGLSFVCIAAKERTYQVEILRREISTKVKEKLHKYKIDF